jgi:hypothetical protein
MEFPTDHPQPGEQDGSLEDHQAQPSICPPHSITLESFFNFVQAAVDSVTGEPIIVSPAAMPLLHERSSGCTKSEGACQPRRQAQPGGKFTGHAWPRATSPKNRQSLRETRQSPAAHRLQRDSLQHRAVGCTSRRKHTCAATDASPSRAAAVSAKVLMQYPGLPHNPPQKVPQPLNFGRTVLSEKTIVQST